MIFSRVSSPFGSLKIKTIEIGSKKLKKSIKVIVNCNVSNGIAACDALKPQ